MCTRSSPAARTSGSTAASSASRAGDPPPLRRDRRVRRPRRCTRHAGEVLLVRACSSGSGFSIASHLEPDVFVVDEALSVGDAAFQERCMERMTKLVRSGTTLIFVSHNLPSVEALCDRGILIEKGRALAEGRSRRSWRQYIHRIEERRIDLTATPANTGPIRIVSASCHRRERRGAHTFGHRESRSRSGSASRATGRFTHAARRSGDHRRPEQRPDPVLDARGR